MLPETFHPVIRAWFERRFEAPTDAQLRGWEAIAEGRDVLVAAPTDPARRLAAFLSSINTLFNHGLEGELPASIDVVYISPLKALSSDIQRNSSKRRSKRFRHRARDGHGRHRRFARR